MDDDPIRIVISYRRDDSSGHAGHLYSDLVARFGEHKVFIDIDAIEPGLDFAEVITSAISSADVFIAVIGKRWLSAADKGGRRKIDLVDDFVRLEIESAVQRKLRIVPVLVQGAEMPSGDDLPNSLATFARRHALEISDKRWRDDVNRLIELLEGIARAKAEKMAGGQARPAGADHDREVWAAEQAAAEQARREREAQVAQTVPAATGVPVTPSGPPVGEWSSAPPGRAGSGAPRGWMIGGAVAAVVVVVALVAALLAVAGGNGDGGGNGGPPPSEPVVKTVEVRSDVPWNDTGIDVESGQTVEFEASGTIETAVGSPSRDSEPDGKDGEEYGNNVIPGVKHGALIAMIGRNEPFPVGAYSSGGMIDAGRLYLGVNDKGVENNAGSYTVTITVY